MELHPAQHWRFVTYLEFDRFLRQYPRPLLVQPPLDKPARFRAWRDVALGGWPYDVVAKQFSVLRTTTYEIRIMPDAGTPGWDEPMRPGASA
jgi:hypothetical protein